MGATSSEARVSVGPRVHLHAYHSSETLSSFNHFDQNADLLARYLTLFIRSFAQALEPMKKGKVKLELACRLLFYKTKLVSHITCKSVIDSGIFSR